MGECKLGELGGELKLRQLGSPKMVDPNKVDPNKVELNKGGD